MGTICDNCEKWVATTWKQHQNRLANMRGIPDARTNPCPNCGSTYWAIKPPPGLPLDKQDSVGLDKLKSGLLKIAGTAKLIDEERAKLHAARLVRDARNSPITRQSEPDHWTTSVRVLGLSAAAILLAALFLLAMAYRAHAQTTFRDSSGRQIGTVTRDANGQTTYRDGSGRMTGTSSTNSNGTTTFRDGAGRMTGTVERRR